MRTPLTLALFVVVSCSSSPPVSTPDPMVQPVAPSVAPAESPDAAATVSATACTTLELDETLCADCELDDASKCYEVANLAVGRARSESSLAPIAVKYATRACDLGGAGVNACFFIREVSKSTQRIEKAEKRGIEEYRRLCKAPNGAHCYETARRLRSIGREDLVVAELFAIGCRGGRDRVSCRFAAQVFEKISLAKRAAELFLADCKSFFHEERRREGALKHPSCAHAKRLGMAREIKRLRDDVNSLP